MIVSIVLVVLLILASVGPDGLTETLIVALRTNGKLLHPHVREVLCAARMSPKLVCKELFVLKLPEFVDLKHSSI